MNYYEKSQYKTRYRVTFRDILGELWTVDIDDPHHTGGVTELTPAGNPLEWEGRGSESQTECLLGSTGYLRIVCMPGQESEYAAGNVRPSEINDRRVTVKRGTQTMWLGFLSCEQYDQPIEPAPYEVELPIKSVVESLADFTLPPYEEFEEPSDTCGLLQYIVKLTGCNIADIVTNCAEYEDFNGERSLSDTGARHWIQGQIVITHWYEKNDDSYSPMTLKDVLESILYPYGHMREYGNSWGIFMAAKESSAYNNTIYMISTDPDVQSGNRFSNTGERITTTNLNDLVFMSDDNRTSILAAPNSVRYSRTLQSDDKIFELSSDMIKHTYTPTIASCITKDYNLRKRYISPISASDVNTYDMRELDIEGTGAGFCRVIDATKKSSSVDEYSYADVCELALLLPSSSKIEMKLMTEVRSRVGYNKIKLTIKEYKYSKTSPEPTDSPVTKVKIKDQGKYLVADGTWRVAESWIDVSKLEGDSNGWYIYFNEPRDNGDNSPHKLKLFFKNDQSGSGNNYTSWIVPELKYEQDTTFTDNHTLMFLTSNTRYGERNISVGGSGDEVDVTMKTMCGEIYQAISGAADIPFCGFKDKVGLIDTQQRKMIDISAVRHPSNQPLWFLRNYILVIDGEKTMIPAAVGCNARDCTLSLKLIQSNIN